MQMETNIKEKTKSKEDMMEKLTPQSIFFIKGCISLLMRMAFNSVMEPVVSLQKLKAKCEQDRSLCIVK